MSIALGVPRAAEQVIRGVTVVDDGAGVKAEHPDVGHGFDAALRVHGDQRQEPGREGVHPVLGGPHGGAGLVGMHDRLFYQAVAEPGEERGEPPSRLGLHGAEPASGDLDAKHVLQQLGRALDGQVLAVEQVSGKSPYLGPEAHRGPGLGREVANRAGPTGAAQAICNVVGHHRDYQGKVDDLADLFAHHLGAAKVGPAGRTARRGTLYHGVGAPALQARPGRTRLLALPAFFGPGLGAALCPFLARPYRVRRRRLATSRGICLPLRFQTSDLVAERFVVRS